eukprot:4575401-Prymnesium_polylepis.1
MQEVYYAILSPYLHTHETTPRFSQARIQTAWLFEACIAWRVNIGVNSDILLGVAHSVVADVSTEDEKVARFKVHDRPVTTKETNAEPSAVLQCVDGREGLVPTLLHLLA